MMVAVAYTVERPATKSMSLRDRGWGVSLESFLHYLLVGLLAFMPLAFGAVEAWSEQVVVVGSMLIGLCFCVKLIHDRSSPRLRLWALAPVAAFLLLAVVQIVPLPVAVLRLISPNTVSLRNELLGGSAAGFAPLTLYRQATAHDLRLLICLCVVFVVALNLYRDVDRIRRLLTALAILGGGLALLALAQDLSGADEIYWSVKGALPKATAGTFILYSHYSQFMTLSIGAALALLLLRIEEVLDAGRSGQASVPEIVERLGDRRMRPAWLLAVSIVIGVTTIFLSLSRGGMIALLLSLVLTAAAISLGGRLRGQVWILVVLAIGAFSFLLYAGFDAVYLRLATLQHLPARYEDRRQILKDVGQAWMKFPVAGAGLGTHDVVFPMFDRSTIPAQAVYAENEYAQVLEETGALGLLIVCSFIAAVAWNYFRALGSRRPGLRPVAIGLGFGLLGILIHSWSDFGQHLPANAFLTAVLCALIVNVGQAARRPRHQQHVHAPAVNGSSQRSGWIAATVVVALSAWTLPAAHAAREGESAWNRAQLLASEREASGWQGNDQDYAKLILAAQAAGDAQPGSAQYRYWLNVYRWRSIARDVDPQTGGVVVYAHTLEYVSHIVDELHAVERLCPTFGPAYSLEGQLELFVLNEPSGAEQIRQGYRLNSCDPNACFTAGWLDAHEGKWDESLEKFRRAQALGTSVSETAAVYVREVGRPDLALALIGDDADARSRVLDLLQQTAGDEAVAAPLRQAVQRQRRADLEAESTRDDAAPDSLASLAGLYRQEGNFHKAASLYRRALASQFAQADWRLALAESLLKMGQRQQALEEARICLRVRPEMENAQKLVGELDAGTPRAAGE
jgi:tetratricopeptide (TPR) repeat protein